ncbi:hypothetical protein M885DRAFT_517160 [Pelagophyceae sp. CCMP2097]|nr:hypothetical protein M885DRAFT_517160 [Pelagophyceae sp. CCMP2097]
MKRKQVPKNAKPKGKKRSKVQRDYDDSEDEMHTQEHDRCRITAEKMDSNRRRWLRGTEAQFDARRLQRFKKPVPASRAKGQTSTQRRNRRKQLIKGDATPAAPAGAAWPTRKELRRSAGLRVQPPAGATDAWRAAAHELFGPPAAGDGAAEDADERDFGQGASDNDSGDDGSGEEDDGEEEDNEAEDREGEEDDGGEEEEEEEEEEEAPAANVEDEEADVSDDDEAGETGEGRARLALMDGQYGRPLSAAEKGDVRARRDAQSYARVPPAADADGLGSWTCSGDALSMESVGASDLRRLAPIVRAGVGEASPLQCGVLRAAATFRDVLATNMVSEASIALPEPSRRAEVLSAALAHVADHVLRSRKRVLRHNKRLKAQKTAVAPATAPQKPKARADSRLLLDDDDEVLRGDGPGADKFRDQGFARARVLVLVPMRSAAVDVVEHLRQLWGVAKVSGRKRLDDEFGADAEETREGPADWEEVFGGNCDDDCAVGLAVQVRRQGVLLSAFAPLDDCDVVVATPMALKLARERGEAEMDFALSSVEIVVIDQADVMLMQNWDHVAAALQSCNRVPKEVSTKTDFSRVRAPVLDGDAAACRQLVVLARFADARLRALVDAGSAEACRNRAGAARLGAAPTPDSASALTAAARRAQHVFQPIRARTPTASAEAKVAYFAHKVIPPLLKRAAGAASSKDIVGARTLVFCNTYHEFVACRAELRRRGANFVMVHEYSRGSEVSRARSNFYHGKAPIMLYSGRAHFYHRYRIRGARRVVFVSPPDHAQFYPEVVGLLQQDEAGAEANHALVLYTRFDALQVERLVGAQKAVDLLTGDRNTDAHIFS